MPDENLDQPTYYPPRRSLGQVEWEVAVQTAIEWCDAYDQAMDNHALDAAEMAATARQVLRRLIDEIRERGL